jgi:hypothetical protein
MADIPPSLFSGLLDHSFKGVSFPAVEFSLTIRHDLAQHKLVDKDGAEIEGTGRAPLQFGARIPFINGISKGPHELWKTPLYPVVFREFVDAVADKATGKLNHPEFGSILVKTEQAHVVWAGSTQGGVFVDVTWLETVENITAIDQFLGAASPVADIAYAAATLDAAFAANTISPTNAQLSSTIPKLPAQSFSFQDLSNSIRGILDVPTLLNQQIGGKIDSIAASAAAVGAALDRASNPVNWPLSQAVQKVIAATNGLRSNILAKKRGILLYTVPQDATLASIAMDIPAPITDLFLLNLPLLYSPIVPQSTIVRYYAAA